MYAAVERGGITGNEHVQGYIHFTKKTPTFDAALKMLRFGIPTLRPHIEKATKPPIANYTYIITGNGGAKPLPEWYISIGEALTQGKRTDIQKVKDVIMQAKHGEIKPEHVMKRIWEDASNFSVIPPMFRYAHTQRSMPRVRICVAPLSPLQSLMI